MEDKTKEVRSACKRAMDWTIQEYYSAVKQNISFTMHGGSPEQHYYVLGAYFDHPFASRHAGIQFHGHEPEWGVHEVEHMMSDELGKKTEYITEGIKGAVGWLQGWDEHVEWVIKGTSKMLPRPVLVWTAQDIDVMKILKDNLKRELKGVKR